MHPTLSRQLERIYGHLERVPSGLGDLFRVVGETYEGFDDDRRLLDRSLEISSRELSAINEQLRYEKSQIEAVVEERTRGLAELSQRLKMATMSGQIGVWDWDIVQNALVWDDTMYTLYGLTKDDFKGSYEAWRRGVHPDDQVRCDKEIQQALQGTKEFDTIFRVVWTDTSVHDIRAFGYVQRDEEHRPLKMIGVNWDITKEKEFDRMKDEFLSIASHELRTPLTAIDGLVAMIRDGEYGPINDNLRAPLEDINASSERLIHLVNDLLNVSRIHSGRLFYVLSDFDIRKIIGDSIKLLRVVADSKHLHLIVDESMPSVMVQADVDKVKEILVNLIGNSLKFTDQGGITISTQVKDDLAVVSIRDTGIGIRPGDASKLFGRFQQLDSGRGRPMGTGLGLFITREMCHKMGGDAYLDTSELGIGSVFAFSLPRTGTDLAHKVAQEISGKPSDSIVI